MTSKSVSVSNFQYLVCPSLLSVTAWMWHGMLNTRYSQWPKHPWFAYLRFSALDDCLYATLSLIKHTFSIGLRYGLFPGHSSTYILFFFRNSVATFDQWQGAPSCMKIVQPWTCMCMCTFSFSSSNFTYLGPFIVVLCGMKYTPAALRHDTPNHCGYIC